MGFRILSESRIIADDTDDADFKIFPKRSLYHSMAISGQGALLRNAFSRQECVKFLSIKALL